MTPFKDLSGQRFGRLVVLEYVGRRGNGREQRPFFLCRCDCGNQKEINGHSLSMGVSRSCGCLHKETSRRNGINSPLSLPRGESSFNALFRLYKNSANKRGIYFNLEEKIFKELTSGNCFYCGTPPLQELRVRGKNKGTPYMYNGIDRVDTSIGYIDGNVVPCCGTCNSSKGYVTVSIMEKALGFLKTSI